MQECRDFQLRISIKSTDGKPLIKISGECDAFTATFTHGAVMALIEEGYKAIIIDISELDFLDVAGFHALDNCCHRAQEVGGKMFLVNPEKQVAEIYNMLRERESCQLVGSIEEAMRLIRQSEEK